MSCQSMSLIATITIYALNISRGQSVMLSDICQVSLYLDKFAGVCQSILHECKLSFLQIICDHDLFVEMPGRDPSDRYQGL